MTPETVLTSSFMLPQGSMSGFLVLSQPELVLMSKALVNPLSPYGFPWSGLPLEVMLMLKTVLSWPCPSQTLIVGGPTPFLESVGELSGSIVSR